MLPRHLWTPLEDDALHTHRANHTRWVDIAHALGVTVHMARERARAIGVRRYSAARTLEALEPSTDPNREPLPAGHPVAWAILTDGTSLAGTASPWPPLPPIKDSRQLPSL